MTKRRIYFYACLTVTLAVLFLLVTGSSILMIALDSKASFPLGTLITWAGMVALPLTLYWGIKELRKPYGPLGVMLSYLLKMTIVSGILWAPVSYILAGNLSFTFTERETFQGGQEAMRWFWLFTYAIVISALVTLIAYWLSLIFRKR